MYDITALPAGTYKFPMALMVLPGSFTVVKTPRRATFKWTYWGNMGRTVAQVWDQFAEYGLDRDTIVGELEVIKEEEIGAPDYHWTYAVKVKL